MSDVIPLQRIGESLWRLGEMILAPDSWLAIGHMSSPNVRWFAVLSNRLSLVAFKNRGFRWPQLTSAISWMKDIVFFGGFSSSTKLWFFQKWIIYPLVLWQKNGNLITEICKWLNSMGHLYHSCHSYVRNYQRKMVPCWGPGDVALFGGTSGTSQQHAASSADVQGTCGTWTACCEEMTAEGMNLET